MFFLIVRDYEVIAVHHSIEASGSPAWAQSEYDNISLNLRAKIGHDRSQN